MLHYNIVCWKKCGTEIWESYQKMKWTSLTRYIVQSIKKKSFWLGWIVLRLGLKVRWTVVHNAIFSFLPYLRCRWKPTAFLFVLTLHTHYKIFSFFFYCSGSSKRPFSKLFCAWRVARTLFLFNLRKKTVFIYVNQKIRRKWNYECQKVKGR